MRHYRRFARGLAVSVVVVDILECQPRLISGQ